MGGFIKMSRLLQQIFCPSDAPAQNFDLLVERGSVNIPDGFQKLQILNASTPKRNQHLECLLLHWLLLAGPLPDIFRDDHKPNEGGDDRPNRNKQSPVGP